MQAWLFVDDPLFWNNETIPAYLSGVDNEDMLILDLFSDNIPYWDKTNNYYGKPFIWNELHDFGGNLGMFG